MNHLRLWTRYSNSFPTRDLPTRLQLVIKEVCRNLQVPEGLAAASVLSAISIAGQGQADVERPNGLRSPISQNYVSIIESGGRKTAVDKVLMEAIRTYSDDQQAKAIEDYAVFNTQVQIWELNLDDCKKSLRKAIKEKDGILRDELVKQLSLLMSKKPTVPRFLDPLIRDITPEALLDRATSGVPIFGLVADEGGQFFQGHAARNLPLLNAAWDGSTQHIDRKVEGKAIIKGLRLTTNIAIQPQTFEKFEMGKGELGRDNGYFARQNWARLSAAFGERFIDNTGPLQWHEVELFNKRIRELLEQTAKIYAQAVECLPLLKMSREAGDEWIKFANYIEGEQQAGGRFEMIKDAASKAAENAARLAALIHLFEGHEGEITESSMISGALISQWYLEQFVDIFATMEIPEQLLNAEKVDHYLGRRFNETRNSWMKKNELLKNGPRRNRKELNEALDVLVEDGQIWIDSTPGGPAIVHLNLGSHQFNAKRAHRSARGY